MKYLLILTTLFLPVLALAQTRYTPIVGIPGVDPNSNFDSYINALYALSISIAALLAVIKIVIAGVKWMMTDVVTSKGDAKKDIQGALIGLLIVLGAVLILTVINPDLTRVNMVLTPISQIAPPSPNSNTPTLSVTPLSAPLGTRGAVIRYLPPGASSQDAQIFLNSCSTYAGPGQETRSFTIAGGGSNASRCIVYGTGNLRTTLGLPEGYIPTNRETCENSTKVDGSNVYGQYTQDPLIAYKAYCTY